MDTILTSTTGAVATITLNRPDKLNAFAGTMREDLHRALKAIGDEERVKVIVLTGAGRAFCAGGDVEAMSRMRREGDMAKFAALLDAGAAIVTAIRSIPQLVIASINGVAAGAGCNLALACDYRIASERAKLGETFVRIGLHPDWGGTFFLPRLAGPARAMELLMSGRLVDAAEAERIGLVQKVVAHESLESETSTLAHAIAAGPPLALRAIKQAVYRSERASLDEQLALEKENQLGAFASSDAAEGMAAFFEKREPRFGRE